MEKKKQPVTSTSSQVITSTSSQVKKETAKAEVKNMPVAKFRSGALSLTIWCNEQEKDGEKFENYSFNIERSYKDKENEWQHTTSFRKRDVSNVDALMNRARDYLYIDEDPEQDTEE